MRPNVQSEGQTDGAAVGLSPRLRGYATTTKQRKGKAMEQSARLRQYNAWRRDNTGELPMPNPTEFGELLDGVADRLEVLERENAMLRKGDTCARMCEGTAYRIEARKLRTALARLAAAVGELPENGSGTVQGAELNAAYSGAMALLTTND